MASRLLWASRVASYLKISTCPSAFSIVIKDLKYANTHEWVKVDGSTATIGITDHAQDHLGDVVYIALLEVGSYVKQGKNFGAVESVKVNASPFEDGWIVKVKSSNDGEVNSLMDSEQYSKFYEEEDAKH
ncbi:glycine cleavage system H protein 2, mitochondrial-like [Zingiber officinale]|uniref:glycine cleavage system H protein 2, mitochondrial-like n=1 Tax=Zingiber officinale TaxID=94328 RepID=UPI001C4B51B5|nr:glycine cleavage system H protein 2, mitochondrial-like [Zingiber officinale]